MARCRARSTGARRGAPRGRHRRALAVAPFLILCLSCAPVQGEHLLNGKNLIIAHRGSPSSHPEETLEGYMEAMRFTPDYLELDLVSTRDGRLVLRHDLMLDHTTNIKQLIQDGTLPARKTESKKIDGKLMHGYFATSYTVDEIKTLTAVQPLPFRDSRLNDAGFKVATLDEMLTYFAEDVLNTAPTGVYMELKHPAFHSQLGFNMTTMLFDALKRSSLTPEQANARLVIQCFDLNALQDVAEQAKLLGYDLPLVWLLECADGFPDVEQLTRLKGMATVTGVGPDKLMLLESESALECGASIEGQELCSASSSASSSARGTKCLGRLKVPPADLSKTKAREWVDRVHEMGMVVHTYTLRDEDIYMDLDFHADPLAELDAVLLPSSLDIDGAFVDAPSTAARWRQLQQCDPSEQQLMLSDLNEQSHGLYAMEEGVAPPGMAAVVSVFVVTGCLVLACVVFAYTRNRPNRAYRPARPVQDSSEMSHLEDEQ